MSMMKQHSKIDLNKIQSIIQKNGTQQAALIPILQQVQDEYGYLPHKALEYIVEHSEITKTELYGVATFYKQFRFIPVGKHLIKICHGTACHVKGAQQITKTIIEELGIQSGETTNDGLFSLETVACLGCCSLAPVMMVDDTVYGRLTVDSVKKILKDYAH